MTLDLDWYSTILQNQQTLREMLEAIAAENNAAQGLGETLSTEMNTGFAQLGEALAAGEGRLSQTMAVLGKGQTLIVILCALVLVMLAVLLFLSLWNMRLHKREAQAANALKEAVDAGNERLGNLAAETAELRGYAKIQEGRVARLSKAMMVLAKKARQAQQVMEAEAIPEMPPEEKITQALRQIIDSGEEGKWRLLLKDRLQLPLLPAVSQVDGETGETVIRVFDDSQEQKLFAFFRDDVLYVFPNSHNLADRNLKADRVFEGCDSGSAKSFVSIAAPARAVIRGQGGYALISKGQLL